MLSATTGGPNFGGSPQASGAPSSNPWSNALAMVDGVPVRMASMIGTATRDARAAGRPLPSWADSTGALPVGVDLTDWLKVTPRYPRGKLNDSLYPAGYDWKAATIAEQARLDQEEQNASLERRRSEFQAEIERQAAEEQAALQMAQRSAINQQFAGADERAVHQGINRGFAGQFGMQPTLQQGRGGSYIPNLIRRGRTAFQQALASIGASDTDAGIPIDSGGPAPAAATAFASPTDFGYSGSTGSAPVETTAPPPAWGGLGVFYGEG